jgi:hypothetical protein
MGRKARISFQKVLNMSLNNAGSDAHTHALSVVVVGQAMSLFLSISFLLCALLAVVVPQSEIDHWFRILPWVAPLTWTSALVGIVETVVYGWFFAMLFVPLYNGASRRAARKSTDAS